MIKKLFLAINTLVVFFLSPYLFADILTSGGSTSAHLTVNDADSHFFEVTEGQAFTLIMAETVSSAGQIFLYRPDGTYWTYGNNVVHVTAPQTGVYTAVVKFSNASHSGTYTLNYVRGGDSVENGSLYSGGTSSSYLSSLDMDSFTFSGAAGEAITLIMEEGLSSAGQLYFYKPDGSYWTYANNLAHLTLPDTGSYTVVARFSNAFHSGAYSIHYVQGDNVVENTVLGSGETVENTLNSLDMDSYRFEGIEGEAVTLTISEEVSSAGQLYFYKPDGSYWTYANNLAHLTLPDTGVYTVVVRYSNIFQQGDYSLHYYRGGQDVENGLLVSGSDQDDVLDALDFDSFEFSGNAGEAITMAISEAVSSVGQMYFYKPDGSYWTYANNIAHLTLPVSGTYSVVVRYSNITQSGPYRLHYVRGGDGVENGSMDLGTIYSSTLNSIDIDSYTFAGLAGQNISLSMSESVSSVGQIYVYRPDGSYWTYGNNILNATLPATGVYTVVVRYSNISQTGPYTLRYSLSP